MLEFEDDAGWEQHADEDDEDATNYDVGLENVDRLAKAFEADVPPLVSCSARPPSGGLSIPIVRILVVAVFLTS